MAALHPCPLACRDLLTPALASPLPPSPQVNASDTRGKADASVLKGVGGKLANAVKELSTNTAVSYDARGNRKKVGVWRVAAEAGRGEAGEAWLAWPAAGLAQGTMLPAAAVVCSWSVRGRCQPFPIIPHPPITAHRPPQLCLVMDEVDGMSAGDRGGVADLILVCVWVGVSVWWGGRGATCVCTAHRPLPRIAAPPCHRFCTPLSFQTRIPHRATLAPPRCLALTCALPLQTIKKSRVPIICICNDKYATKLKSLKGHCLELDYRK